MKYYVILDGWRPVTVLSDETDCRSAHRCGGCDACQMMQAAHCDLDIRELKGFWKLYEWVYWHFRNVWLRIKRLFVQHEEF